MLPGKLDQPAGKEILRIDDAEANELDEISCNFNHLDGVAANAVHLAEMIKTLQQAIEAKQRIEPKLKRPKTYSRVRILKYCNWYMCY